MATSALAAVLLHVRSSRRRNLAVALATLDRLDAPKGAVSAIGSALAATGKPRALGPALLALALVALAAAALVAAKHHRDEAAATLAPEAVA